MEDLEVSSKRQAVEKGVKRKLSKDTTIADLLEGWTRCCYLITHKQRLCGMDRAANSMYCVNHIGIPDAQFQVLNSEQSTSTSTTDQRYERIPCPLDSSHNIFVHNRDSHILICNAAKRQAGLVDLPYYRENCNGGKSQDEITSSICQPCGDSSSIAQQEDGEVDLDVLLHKINQIYDEIRSEIPSSPNAHHTLQASMTAIDEAIRSHIGKEQSSFSQLRHVEQDIMIVREMVAADLLLPPSMTATSNKATYLEFGAGKGLLAFAVHFADESARLGLIERSSNRRKVDRFLASRNATFERYRMDIRHCYLPALPLLSLSEQGRVVVMAKHLCGVASDLALRSLTHLSSPSYRRGLSIATCCHHACVYEDYVGSAWLKLRGIGKDEFDIMRYWSGWASLGRVRTSTATADIDESNKTNNGQDEKEDQEHGKVDVSKAAKRPKSLSHDQISVVGRRIKRIIDYGRLVFIRQELGMNNAGLVQYCMEELSPECMLLIATDEAKAGQVNTNESK